MDNNNLPPKVATIDQLVTVPEDIKKVIAGKKQATRRNGRYADTGEVMKLEGHEFVVTSVYREKLKDMKDEDAIREGYDTLADYQSFILSMNTGIICKPELQLWNNEYYDV